MQTKFKTDPLKRTLFILLFILFSTMAFKGYSQKVNIGSQLKGESFYSPVILGEDESHLYVLASKNNGKYLLEAYDKANKQSRKFSIPIDHEKINKKFKVEIEDITLLKNDFIVIYSYFDKGKNEYILFSKAISKKDGKIKDARRDLLHVEVEKKRRRGDFEVMIPEDRSKIFLYHEAYYKSQKKTLRKYVLLNEEMEILFQKSLDIEEFMPDNFLVDNDGSIYYFRSKDKNLFIGSFDANKNYEKWEEKVDMKHDKVEELKLHNVMPNINSKGELTVTGLVSSKDKKAKGLLGSFYIAVDRESKEIRASKINKFKEEFFGQFRNEKKMKKGKGVEWLYSREKVVDKEDGGVVMMLESYFEHSFYDRNGREIARSVEYGDIISMNFKADGEMLWANRIPKRQVFNWQALPLGFIASTRGLRFFLPPNEWKTTRHFSYSSALFDNKLVLIYNDDIKNITQKQLKDKQQKFKKPEKGVVVKYELDLESGQRKKEIYHDLQKTPTLLCPSVDYQKNTNSSLVLFGINKKIYSFHTICK